MIAAAPVIDGHSHIASARYIPRRFLEGVAENIAAQSLLTGVPLSSARVLDRLLAGYEDHSGAAQLAQLNRLGIARAILLLADFTYALPGGQSIAQSFEEHAAILRAGNGRFSVFAGADPRWGAAALDLFIRGVEEFGFAGLKLYPPCGYRADAPALTPFYAYCNEHHLPVLIHIGPTSPVLSFTEADPRTIDEPARRFPNIAFILAHGAVHEVETCIALCRYRPNVYLDLSGAQGLARDGQPTGGLAQVLAAGIGHKIIFGTDWPINRHERLNAALLDVLAPRPGGLTARESRLILGGNMARLLAANRAPGRQTPNSFAPPQPAIAQA